MGDGWTTGDTCVDSTGGDASGGGTGCAAAVDCAHAGATMHSVWRHPAAPINRPADFMQRSVDAPTRLVRDLPHETIWGRSVAKDQRITDVIKGDAEHGEVFGRRRV